MTVQNTSVESFDCDWCGEKNIRVRFVAYGERTCEHCAPYAHAAMTHPENCGMAFMYLSGQRYCPTCDWCQHENITHDGLWKYHCSDCGHRFELTSGGLKDA